MGGVMSIVLDGTSGITTPELDSGPVAGSTANFSGNVTLGTSVLETPVGGAPSYTCRAWVNFDGTTTTPTIRASGNVSSVTKLSTGSYQVDFSTNLPDANFASVFGASNTVSNLSFGTKENGRLSSHIRVQHFEDNTVVDTVSIHVSVFR
jgi:hypothetical protein